MRAFLVRLPSGCRYWTVLDEAVRPHPEVDEFLLHVRLGRAGAESTTQSYAISLALFLRWSTSIGRIGGILGRIWERFVYWLQHYGQDATGPMANPRILLRDRLDRRSSCAESAGE
jgi:hypothetical protein